MQLPRYDKKKKKEKLKYCQEPGCRKEYWGHPISKYCELHKDIRKRQKRKKVFEAVDVKNIVFQHNYKELTDIVMTCHLSGCSNTYSIQLVPKQYVYPKYCEQHRSEYQRDLFLRRQKATSSSLLYRSP